MEYKSSFLDDIAHDLQDKREIYFAEQPLSTRYWILRNACATKETGKKFPQVKEIIGGNYWDDGRPESVRNITYGVIPVEDRIDFGVLRLYKSSKVSDTISAANLSSDGFYLSEFAKEIFSQFNLGEHKYFPVTFLHEGIYYNYFWLQLKTDFNPYINFDRSIFYEEIGILDGSKTEIKVSTLEELMRMKDRVFKEWSDKKREYTSIRYKYIELNKDIPAVDIFGFSRLGIDLFITQGLKDAILQGKLTGFDIKDQRQVHFLL